MSGTVMGSGTMSGGATVTGGGAGTVITVGSATITVESSDALYGLSVASLRSALEGADVTDVPTVTGLPTIPAAPTGSGNHALVIPDADNSGGAAVTVPTGYNYVVYQGQGTLSGGDSSTAIIGASNYTGGAGTVLGTGSVGGSVSDSTADAVLGFVGGANTVTAGGAGQKVGLGGGLNLVNAIATGQIFNQSGGSSTINSSASVAGASTAVASGGNLTFLGFGAGDDVVSVSGASTRLQFLGTAGTDTITGGAGADTVVAGSASYTGGAGSDLFVGGKGASTLHGAAQETIYSGTGGGAWFLASNSTDVWSGGGGADTVQLGSGTTTAQLWSNDNEHLSLGAASGASGAVVVGFGQNQAIDMTQAAGNDTVILWNAQVGVTSSSSGFAFTGNTTLTASNAGHDMFVMFAASPFGAGTEAAHTIVINNWQASDVFDLSSGYTTAEAQAATQALTSGAAFTLSDGTTVQFAGAKPTVVIHN